MVTEKETARETKRAAETGDIERERWERDMQRETQGQGPGQRHVQR